MRVQRPGRYSRISHRRLRVATFHHMAPDQVDVVVLSRILHDWDLSRCEKVLALARSLLRPGGALLVAEMLLDPDRLGPVPALLQVRGPPAEPASGRAGAAPHNHSR